MIQSPVAVAGHYTTTVHNRPIRFAYFVEESDVGAFTQAARIASTRGGIYNLIILLAVGRESQICHGYFERLLTLFEPDIFVPSGPEKNRSRLLDCIRNYVRAGPWRDHNAILDGATFDEEDDSMHAVFALLPRYIGCFVVAHLGCAMPERYV